MIKGTKHSIETITRLKLLATGHKLSDSAKEKLRIYKTGTKASIETKIKISNALKGVAKSEEHKLKISKTLTGKKRIPHTFETRKKIGDAQKGEKHHNWKGGITHENIALRNSIEYKEWRRKVFCRDNFTCILCKKKGVKLNADHIKSFAHFPKLRFVLSNGRTLCLSCHEKTPNYRNKKYVATTS